MPITVPTVLVLGAGASHSYGFPLGTALRDQIAGFTGDFRYQVLMRRFGYSTEQVGAFSRALKHSAYGSVDAFLEAEPVYAPLGKLSIALALLPLEKSSNLFPPSAPAAHWYQHLVALLDVGKPGWIKNKLTILTFNYDRSLEHYLTTVIAQRHKTSLAEAAAILKRVEIIHMHGKLGSYPGLGRAPIPYGHEKTTDGQIVRAAANVRIVSEPSALSPFVKAGKRLARAKRLVFLGFGFASISMQRLEEHCSRLPPLVGGTSKGLTDLDWRRVTRSHFAGRWLPRSRRSILDYLRSDMDLSYNPNPLV